jgi:hypothetical protein
METERELSGVRTRSSFMCTVCGVALTEDDFVVLDLRPPEPGETLEEYAEAELVDAIVHRACAESRGGD